MARCKLADCTVATDGRCLEARKDNCPNLIASGPTDDAASNVSAEPEDQGYGTYPATEDLYSGLPLEIQEAREFSSRGRAVIVALTGMTECGKTSLLARLHQQFQNGPVGGYDFVGSRTLFRFEEMNWLATVESGVESPKMEHSSQQYDNSFLQLTVRRHAGDEPPVDLLLNDISGETYPEAIISESVCERLLCLRRADHLAVLVDGGAIADRGRRHDHCAKAKNFVQRALQTGQVGRKTVLHLVVTKRDELLKEAHAIESLEAAKRLEDEFRARFTGSVGWVSCWQLAARPLDGTMPTEEVVSALFAAWVSSTRRYEPVQLPVLSLQAGARDFCRFMAQ